MGIPSIKNKAVPAAGEEYVMECTLTVETFSDGETIHEWSGKTLTQPHRRVKFEGYATKEVVEHFLGIGATMAGCAPYAPYIVAPDKIEVD